MALVARMGRARMRQESVMANIRIDPDTMDMRVQEYRSEAEQVGQVISNMDRLLSQLQSEWEGSASQSYADRFNSDLRPSFMKAQELIEEIAKSLQKTAQLMREQDANIAAGFKA